MSAGCSICNFMAASILKQNTQLFPFKNVISLVFVFTPKYSVNWFKRHVQKAITHSLCVLWKCLMTLDFIRPLFVFQHMRKDSGSAEIAEAAPTPDSQSY